MNLDNIYNVFTNFNSHTDDYLGAMYISIFHDLPHAYRIYFDKNGDLGYHSSSDEIDCVRDIKFKIDDRVFLQEAIKNQDKLRLTTFCYSQYEWVILYDFNHTYALINVTLNDDPSSDYYLAVYTNDIKGTYNFIKDWIHKTEIKKTIEFGITAVDPSNSLYTSWYDYTNHEIDIEKNYNDTLPYEKMCQLLESTDKPELLLFYGEPGTGKTTLIKHFISKYHDKDFVFMDGSLMANIGQEKLMSYFLENQHTIFILEDCEKILMNREHYVNPVMPILLNLTDGIIGDVLGIKLICTFNTSLSNIDKALTRKGRLSLKYEFKKLTKDKVEKILCKPVDKEMSLADIYYNDDENDFSKKPQNKIGFN